MLGIIPRPMPAEINLAPQLLEEKKRRRRWLIIACVLLVLLLGAGIESGPIYRAIKGWRARQLARGAEEFVSKQAWQDATSKARSAYQLKPDEPAAIRAVAHIERATGHPSGAI